MKTKAHISSHVRLVTLGCAKNTVDSETLLGQLKGNGIRATHAPKAGRSDVVVINTCGFIEAAKQESIDAILEWVDAKERGAVEKVYVTGCLSQRYRTQLAKEIPGVDAWLGTGELSQMLKALRADYKHELVGERELITPGHFAYLKISEGCDRPCSFCAIPLMRGRHVSRPMDQLIHEARKLASRGVKELLLIAQDSTYYGIDRYGKRMLPELLRQLADVEGISWIRLHYAFPTGFPMEALEVMAERSTICNYLDMPLQHGATRMLRAMRRGTTQEKTKQLIDAIREKAPGIALRTTMMVGYPGETDQDFEEMMHFVEWARFERMGVFTYSHEEGTAAYTLKDDVPPEVKKERMDALMALQQGLSEDANRGKIGSTFKTLIDRKEGARFIGRTEFDSPEIDNEVIVEAGDRSLRVGRFVPVKIYDANEFDLIGTPV